ncbi:major facilitator superfamily domain-containing protein [Trichophaea hybrida]|nr:major facilitator superfamily domain-containing protein [Trichophaea hybrida]
MVISSNVEPPSLALHPRNPLRRIFGSLRAYATFLCAVLIVTLFIAVFLSAAPQLRLIESIICSNYYRENDRRIFNENGNIPEQYCKVDSIQEELAFLNGFQTLFSNIPGVLLAIPYGVLADRYGRKIILVLALLGLTLSFSWILFVCWFALPIKLTWLSAAFLMLGGGVQMLIALILMVLADVTPADQRTTAFFQLQACVLFAELVAPPLSSVLMSHNVWTPLLIALVIMVLVLLIACALPETRGLEVANTEPSNSSGEEQEGDERISRPNLETSTRKNSNSHRDIMTFLRQDINVTLLVAIFLVITIGRQTTMLLLQYVSKRYDWSLAKSSLLLSLRAGFNLALMLAGLPVLTSLIITKWKMSTTERDLYISRTSACLVTLGFLGIAIAPNPSLMIIALIVDTLGSGFGASTRSLATTMVHPSNIGKLYTSIAVFDTLGALVGGPSMSLAFQWGIKLGGGWIGLPFLVLAILSTVVTVVVFMVRLAPTASYEPLNGEEAPGQTGEEDSLLASGPR